MRSRTLKNRRWNEIYTCMLTKICRFSGSHCMYTSLSSVIRTWHGSSSRINTISRSVGGSTEECSAISLRTSRTGPPKKESFAIRLEEILAASMSTAGLVLRAPKSRKSPGCLTVRASWARGCRIRVNESRPPRLRRPAMPALAFVTRFQWPLLTQAVVNTAFNPSLHSPLLSPGRWLGRALGTRRVGLAGRDLGHSITGCSAGCQTCPAFPETRAPSHWRWPRRDRARPLMSELPAPARTWSEADFRIAPGLRDCGTLETVARPRAVLRYLGRPAGRGRRVIYCRTQSPGGRRFDASKGRAAAAAKTMTL